MGTLGQSPRGRVGDGYEELTMKSPIRRNRFRIHWWTPSPVS